MTPPRRKQIQGKEVEGECREGSVGLGGATDREINVGYLYSLPGFLKVFFL